MLYTHTNILNANISVGLIKISAQLIGEILNQSLGFMPHLLIAPVKVKNLPPERPNYHETP